MEKKRKVLIIKTGYSEFLEEEKDSRTISFGDIIRTTPLLHIYKNDYVTWVTDESAFPLLKENKYIARLLRVDWITAAQLTKERFDIIINLEKVPGICAMTDSIYAVKRYGFRFDPETARAEAYDRASEILTVSSDIEVKKTNRKTAQELLFEMVGEKWSGEEYILGYEPKTTPVYDVGLNIFVGKKWPNKRWPDSKWDKLEEDLRKSGLSVSRQDKQSKEILNDLYVYMDWVNSCKIIVSSDSLGMHLGFALKKKVLVLLGPTPVTEIYFYNNSKGILPNESFDCVPCFEEKCRKEKNCMEEGIPYEKVYKEVMELAKNDGL